MFGLQRIHPHCIRLRPSLYPPGLVGKGADMSHEIDWDFSGSDDAKAEIRAAVGYLLKDTPGSDRGEIVWQIMAIVNQVARALPGALNPLDDGMPGG